MRAISLFSGVGGMDRGFELAGIETILQAERDPHCLKVLERHWPQTERVSDVRCVGQRESAGRCVSGASGAGAELGGRETGAGIRGGVDLIYGGFPCQDLSVAGKRAGLGGERSGLWYEFHRVLSELRPRWTVIENVPGLLSSNEGRDFGIILDGLGELGYGVSWAVLDAQHFGVPQRRRRVFIVGSLGDGRASQVLAICESCGGDTAKGRTQGERVAATIRGRSSSPGVNMPGRGGEDDNNLVTVGSIAVHTANTSSNGWGVNEDTAYTLDGANGQAVTIPQLAAPLGSNENGGMRLDLDNDTYIPEIVGALSDGAHHGGGLNGQDAYTGRIIASHGVRRLTPLECERLQGFPDGWTDGQADSHRYRQLGNAVCVPVAEYLAHRLRWVDEHMR